MDVVGRAEDLRGSRPEAPSRGRMKKAAARVGLWSRNSRGCATVPPRSRGREGLVIIGPTTRIPKQKSPPQPKPGGQKDGCVLRSEEHTSELQSLRHLVCRLLLE